MLHHRWKRSTRGKGGIHPGGVGQDRWINRLNESAWLVREEIAVWVELGFYIRIQLPVWGEAKRPASCRQNPTQPKQENESDDRPIPSFVLSCSHARIH